MKRKILVLVVVAVGVLAYQWGFVPFLGTLGGPMAGVDVELDGSFPSCVESGEDVDMSASARDRQRRFDGAGRLSLQWSVGEGWNEVRRSATVCSQQDDLALWRGALICRASISSTVTEEMARAGSYRVRAHLELDDRTMTSGSRTIKVAGDGGC